MKLKTCRYCGKRYDEGIGYFEDDATEYDGYGRILYYNCRHDMTINRYNNKRLR